MNLPTFIEAYQDAITRAVLGTFPPVYTARNRDEWGFDLRRLRRRPLSAQGDAIRAVADAEGRYGCHRRGAHASSIRNRGATTNPAPLLPQNRPPN